MDEITFGRYRLRALIGQGGMGRVYKAYDTSFDRTVALKLLPPQLANDPAFRERFRREAHSAGNLHEPHIVPIYDYGEQDGHLFLTMPLIDGTDLGSLLSREGSMSPERAVSIIDQAASALDAAHAAGLVHRDVKPANILVTARNFVYLIDFGIARANSETGLTGTGATIGTMAYMAPERLESGRTDARTDVYALACVLYECLSGARPFPGTSLEHVIAAHLTKPPPRPSYARPDLPALFDDVIAMGMAKNPEHRFASAGALARAAHSALISRVPPQPPPTAPPPWGVPGRVPQPPETVAIAPFTGGPRFPTTPPPPHHFPPRPQSGPVASGGSRAPAIVIGVIVVLVLIAGVAWVLTRDGTSSGTGPDDTSSSETSSPTYAVTGTIPVGDGPYGVAVEPGTQTVYVVNGISNSVSVIDATTYTVTATIPVGLAPFGVVIVPETRTGYVTNFDAESVSVIDTANNTVTATILVGFSPHAVAIEPHSRNLYVANQDSDSVSVIDTAKNTVAATIPVGDAPSGVAIETANRFAYVTNANSNSVSVINTATNAVTATIPVGEAPYGVSIHPSAKTAYVANADSDSVSVIDTVSDTVTATIPVGDLPGGVAIDPDERTAYVTNGNANSISVIDTASNKVIDTIPVGEFPCLVAVDPDARTVYVTNNGSDTMSVISGS